MNNKGFTYEINIEDAVKEYIRNKEFRDFLEKGSFVHCENRFVLKHPKYVKYEDGALKLTEYAKSNQEECCIIFKWEVAKEEKEKQDNEEGSVCKAEKKNFC